MSITTSHVSVVQNQGDEGEDDAEELPDGARPGELWLVKSWSRDLSPHLWLARDQVPDERVREMVLEEHLECGCACHQLGHRECLGRFNTTTCECGCSVQQFGQVEALNIFWTKYFSLTLHVSRGQVMPHPRPVTRYLPSPCLSLNPWSGIESLILSLHCTATAALFSRKSEKNDNKQQTLECEFVPPTVEIFWGLRITKYLHWNIGATGDTCCQLADGSLKSTMHLSFKDIKFVHNFLYLIILHFKVVQKLLHSITE